MSDKVHNFQDVSNFLNISSFLRKLRFLIVALLPLNLAHAAAGQPLPTEAWSPKIVGFSVGLYYLKMPATDPAKSARILAADKRFSLKVVDKLDRTAMTQALLTAGLSTNPTKEFPPPTPELLHYFGRGLTTEQAAALQKAPQALILGFAHPVNQRATGLRRAEQFVFELAKQGGAIIWDDETREAFTPDAWEKRRMKTWEGDVPDVSQEIVIHAYNSDAGRTRAISLGMAKFGLPDLVIDDSVWSLNRPLGNAINAVAQQLVEAGPPDNKGQLQLKIKALRHAESRKRLMDEILPGGKAEGPLRLLVTTAEQGDPENALVGLNFDSYPGKEAPERQTNFVMAVFGAQQDEIKYANRGDAALRAASERARAQLPMLQKVFQNGLTPGEQLQVKVPFATADGGKEWMWVEVLEWKGDQIKGVLRNEPRNVPGVKVGQTVSARQSDVFDYLRIFADGRTEGNETSKLLK
jgi:uncharacterized protein YegJ (DUF2314 family)